MSETSLPSIRLVFLARLRDVLGSAGEDLTLPSHVLTVGELRGWLAGRGDHWARELAPGRAVRVAINHSVVDAGATVSNGDEVAFFPPVTGG
jgi:molybdopterin synthase sulfur carrier subunit